MTDPWAGHDDFCNSRIHPDFIAEQDRLCNCRTLRRVRADEREQAARRIESVTACYSVAHSSNNEHLGWDMVCRGHLIAAARGEDKE